MTRLIMIRHGETSWNVENRKQGRNDQPLNSKGEIQAKLVADYAKSKYQIERVWTSPLKRCSDTAELFNLPVSISDLLIEIDYGEWEGMLQSEIDSKYPAQDQRNSTWREAPGGEKKSNLPIRGRKWIEESMINDQQGDVVVVGHGGSMKGLLVALLELPDYAMDSFQIDNCSVTTVEIREGVNVLTVLNYTAHLI